MSHRRRPGSPVPASPLENDDILSEILLLLPPAPSSLSRASLVCKRWRRLVSDRVFLRRFRAHHRRNAPLLGFFTRTSRGPSFTPTLDAPNRLPRWRFSLKLDEGCKIFGCRHGLVLFLNRLRRYLLVWDPVTGDVSRVAFPPGFTGGEGMHGAVLRAASYVHNGDHHSIPFLVALVANDEGDAQVVAHLYSSVTGLWGDAISTACPSMLPMYIPSALIGGSLYWMLGVSSFGILEFDIDRQRLAVIDLPPNILTYNWGRHCIMPTEGGSLGFLSLSDYIAELWMMKKGSDGVARWVLGRTIELDQLLSLDLDTVKGFPPLIFGFAEEDNVSFLGTSDVVYMVQLESMQFKKPFKLSILDNYHSFASVYTAGLGIDDGSQLLGNA
ncbi:hypothetical protein PR202_ga07067 [Eleusine coracana subsp. coracana]|uniref:F-box domain-containing protein n=1 Tax=Eleusine coracana subsp. coracana TaxID=191504 RepID=A0AAV5BXR3_ELECO|nr:hypothetical protein QOZ80_2AG0107950 [Eleusine coracana subsp. coracana]GJM90757.1 hypothetical protein PR202_ga07067 [Eleusine coracana subsp. coracana]